MAAVRGIYSVRHHGCSGRVKANREDNVMEYIEAGDNPSVSNAKITYNRCWSPNCNRRIKLRDWAGWHWCIRHWYRNWKWGGGNRWFELKKVRFNISGR